jgi:hypothetical protein
MSSQNMMTVAAIAADIEYAGGGAPLGVNSIGANENENRDAT